MLNELSQVVTALERVGVVTASRHPRMKPMSKNSELLIVRLNDTGKPTDVEFIHRDKAAALLRVEHGSAGSSFPGFNLPTPLLDLAAVAATELKPKLAKLCEAWKKPSSAPHGVFDCIRKLADSGQPRQFTSRQCQQFKLSVVDLVHELQPLFTNAPPELTNFTRLLEVVSGAELALPQFSENVTDALLRAAVTGDRETLKLAQDVLFGVLDWKKRASDFASASYWREKAKQDRNANQPLCLDLVAKDHRFKPVAHPATSELVNQQAINGGLKSGRKGRGGKKLAETDAQTDAFSGTPCDLADVFPEPTIAQLGPFKLFSAHKQNPCLSRYGRIENGLFPISKALVQRMSDDLLYLANDKKKGVTCQPIPSPTRGSKKENKTKSDLLIAYLEEVPDFAEALADLFGGEAQSFSDTDFAARTQPVLEALQGKLKTNPSLKVRLLALCSLDKGRKQISLHRQFRAQDVVRAAQAWKAGAANAPPVSIWFYDKQAKATVWKTHFVPNPLDVSSVVNRVWSSNPKAGFSCSFQRAVTAADAYDVFFADGPLSAEKTRLCLSLLLNRMSAVLARLGAVKNCGDWREWASLSDPVRWQCAKAVSLQGIFLDQLGHTKDNFMKDTIYQIGRLLALADSLHFHYCKWVRTPEEKRKQNKVEAPSELLGNSVFNYALDNPTGALARLAERIKPYKAWADTFDGEEAGLVHWFVRQMGESEKLCALDMLPKRMTDADKAKLLLGYLADYAKKESQSNQPTKTN
jgi:hypothetical protein